MSDLQRILIAGSDHTALSLLHEYFIDGGVGAVSRVNSPNQLVEASLRFRPDLLIADWQMPFEEIYKINVLPIIGLYKASDRHLSNSSKQSAVVGCLACPLRMDIVALTVAVAIDQFRQLATLRSQVLELQKNLQNRKVVEMAKGFVMEKLHINEADAHRYLQRQARQQRKKLIEVAKCVVAAVNILNPVQERKNESTAFVVESSVR